MKKWFPIFMVLLTVLLLLRVSFNNNQPLSISRTLATAGDYGSFFDFDDFFVDAQKVQWNFKGLTNALRASAGSDYEIYSWVAGDHPAHANMDREQIIINKQGVEVGHFTSETQNKPAWSAWVTEWLAYISRFLGYVGSMFVSIGGLMVDVLFCLIRSIYGVIMLLYHLCVL